MDLVKTHLWVVFFAVICVGVRETFGTGFIELEFVSYINEKQSKADDSCCEKDTSNCRFDCHSIYHICLSKNTSVLSACQYGHYRSNEIQDDNIKFHDTKLDRNLAAPYTFRFLRWQGNVRLKIHVNLTNGEAIAPFKEVTLAVGPSMWNTSKAIPLPFIWEVGRGKRKRISKELHLKYKIECDEGYLLPDCYKKYCIPQNNIHGGYNCTGRGEKVCLNGWSGSDCTISNMSSSPSSMYLMPSSLIESPEANMMSTAVLSILTTSSISTSSSRKLVSLSSTLITKPETNILYSIGTSTTDIIKRTSTATSTTTITIRAPSTASTTSATGRTKGTTKTTTAATATITAEITTSTTTTCPTVLSAANINYIICSSFAFLIVVILSILFIYYHSRIRGRRRLHPERMEIKPMRKDLNYNTNINELDLIKGTYNNPTNIVHNY